MSMSSGPLPLIGRLDAGVEPDRPEVDVLVEVEPEPEQDPLLEHARRHAGMADGPEEDGVAAAQVVDVGVGQDLAGLQVALAAEVEGHELVVETLEPGDRRRAPPGPRAITSGPTPSPAMTPILIKTASAAAESDDRRTLAPIRSSPGRGRVP